jgi:hypothetical protein
LTVALLFAADPGGSSRSRSQVAPGALVDQSNPPRTTGACPGGGWGPDTPADYAAQTFTAGVTGALTDIVLPLAGTNPTVVIAVTTVAADGQPVVATPLGSTPVTFTPLPRTFTNVDVTLATPVRIQKGTQYAVVLSAPNEDSAHGVIVFWAADLGASVTGPSASPCEPGIYPGGRAWTHGLGAVGADADFFFETDVIGAKRLTVAKAGSGNGSVRAADGTIDCGATCTADLSPGRSVTLSAAADSGSVFMGWVGGGC